MKKNKLLFISVLTTFSIASSVLTSKLAFNATADEDRAIIYIGERVEISSKTLTNPNSGISKVVNPTIYTPSKGSFAGKAFTALEPGLYKVVWKAIIDNEEIKEEKEYQCLAKGVDFFDLSGSVSKEYGSFSFKESYTGSKFTVSNGSTINFNRPFNIRKFDKTKPFIDFVIDPETYGACDFTQLNIRLTDAKDVNNYVEYALFNGGHANDDRIYSEAKYSGSFFVGYGDEVQQGQWVHNIRINDKYGAAIQSSFCASKGGGKIETNSIKLYFDDKENACYVSPAANGLPGAIPIIDFDDPEVYKGSTWGGFISDDVYVSLIPSSFSKSTGKIIVNSIGGYDLSNEIIQDKEKPVINVNVSDYCNSVYEVPNAKVGSTYKVFDADVIDNFDSDLIPNVTVKYLDPNKGQVDVRVINGVFETKYEGTYKINYDATDHAGNVADRVSLTVSSTNTVQDITLGGVSSSLTGELFERFDIPKVSDVTTLGGSGKIKITRTIIDPKGNVIEPENNQLLLDEIGDYVVQFNAYDICGNTGTLVSKINVPTITKPKFIEALNLPKAFMKGYKHTVQPIKGIEVIDGKVVELSSDITINGEPISEITPTNTDNINIKYILNGKTGSSDIISKVIPVVDTQNGKAQAEYFKGDLSVTENTDHMLLIATESNQETQFINKISTDDFSLRFTKIATKSNFDSFYVKLVDALDATNTLTIVIDVKNAKYSIPTIDGMSNDDLTIRNSEFGIGFTNSKKRITDLDSKELTTISYNDNHEMFKGFSSGAYLSFGFNNRKGNSAVKLNKINNQSFGYDVYGMGITIENAPEDSTKPSISFNEPLETEQFIGDEFKYPTFSAYDVLSDIVSTSIQVTNESGLKIKTNNALSKDSFTITEYGTYTIRYTAKDSCGNETRVSKTVFVYDNQAPTIQVNKLSKTEYKVGDTIQIPGYTANDNSDKYIVDVILGMPLNEYRLLTHDVNGDKSIVFANDKLYEKGFYVNDSTFKVTKAGEYKLRYVCYDEAYNKTVVELQFRVK